RPTGPRGLRRTAGRARSGPLGGVHRLALRAVVVIGVLGVAVLLLPRAALLGQFRIDAQLAGGVVGGDVELALRRVVDVALPQGEVALLLVVAHVRLEPPVLAPLAADAGVVTAEPLRLPFRVAFAHRLSFPSVLPCAGSGPSRGGPEGSRRTNIAPPSRRLR